MNELFHFSLLETYNKIKEELIIDSNEKIMPFEMEKVEKIFKSNLILIEEQYKINHFFSNVFILYDNEYYPLFFYQTRVLTVSNKKYIRRNEKLLIINPYIINILENHNISVDYIYENNDPQELYFKITSAIKLIDVDNHFKVITGIVFFDKSIPYLASLFNYLKEAIEGKSTDKKLIDFFTTIPADSILNADNKPFSLYSKTYESIKQNKAIRVSIQDNNLLNDYIIKYLDQILSRRENVLFIVKDDKNYNKLLELFKKKYLSQIVYSGSKYSKKEMLTMINKELSTHFYNERKVEFQKYVITKNKVAALTNDNIGSFPFSLKEEEINFLMNIVIHGSINSIDTFDTSKYTIEDLYNDINFNKEIYRLDKINIENIKNNVFYGLTSTGKRQNYDLMMITMVQIIDKLKLFNDLLMKMNIKSLDDKEITSFESFELYVEMIELISKYNGFPKKYFEATITEENQENFIDLKRMFKNVSSSTLVVKNIFKRKIFNYNIQELLLNYDLKGSKRIQALEQLKKIVRRKCKKTDAEILIKILRSYLNSKKELDEKLPDYIKDYGESISNMNGVMEIESNIKYIVSFNKMKRKYDYFNLNNKIIKKAFKDYAYSKEIYENCLKLSDLYKEIQSKINLYIGYFLDDDLQFLTANFIEIQEHFYNRLHGKYDEFYQYSLFISSLNKSSIVLQEEIKKIVDSNKSLNAFEYYYFTSLIRSYQRLKSIKYKNQQSLFDSLKCDLIFALLTSANNFDRLKQDKYFSIVKDTIKQKEYLSKLKRIRENNLNFDLSEINILKEVIPARFPITIIKTELLPYVNTNQYEHAIIVDSYEFDDYEIFSSLRIATDSLFISKKNHTDQRLSIYPEYVIDPSLLYLNSFNIKSIPKSFMKLLEKELKKRDYKLVTKNPIFPLIIESIKEPLSKIALLPDIFISGNNKNEIYSSLPKFLIRTYSLPIFYMDTINFILNPLKEFFVIDDQIDTINEMYRNYLLKKKTCKYETNDEKYQKEIERIISSFDEYKSREEIDKMLNDNKYDEVFNILQPVKKEIVKEINNSDLNRYIDYMKNNIGIIIEKDGFYMDVSKGMIKFRKSNKETRKIEDLSTVEFMQGIKEFVSSFKYFNVDELETIFAALLGYKKSDPNFSLRFKEAIFMLVQKKIITIKDDNASLML